MNLNPLRAILRLTADAAEALLFVIDYNKGADALWYADKLAEAEEDIEVWEWPECHCTVCNPEFSSVARDASAGSAAEETPPDSILDRDVVDGGPPNLRDDLAAAARVCRIVGGDELADRLDTLADVLK